MTDSNTLLAGTLLDGEVSLRLVTIDDDHALTAAYLRNREYLQPWEPIRPERFYTAAGQRELLAGAAAEQDAGRGRFWILTTADRVVGRISLTDIVRGAFQNGNLGYWIAEDFQGRGLASAAAAHVCAAAASALGLHRIQAGTLLVNHGSQRVLARAGFTKIGVAENYIRIDGAWRDHILFQRILATEPA